MLEFYIQGFEKQILDDEEMDKEDEKKIKMTRNDYVWFKNLPYDLVKEQLEEAKVIEEKDDPYMSSAEILSEQGLVPTPESTS